MVQAQQGGGQQMPSQPGKESVNEMMRESVKDLNKPLRKALSFRKGMAVHECLDGCFTELKKPENIELLRKAADALKAWNQGEKARSKVDSVGDLPLETRVKFAERAVLIVQDVRDRLMKADATGLRIPTGGEFTDLDNNEARWRIVDLAVNAYVVSKGYANIQNADEVVSHFVKPKKGSVTEDFKKILVEKAWANSR